MRLAQISAITQAPAGARPRAGLTPKPPTALRSQAAARRPSFRAVRCAAAVADTAQQLQGWLAAAGVDVGKQAAALGGSGGLVASRPVKQGEQLLAIPQSAWITPDTAQQSDIGQHLAGCARACVCCSCCRGSGRHRPCMLPCGALRHTWLAAHMPLLALTQLQRPTLQAGALGGPGPLPAG